MLNPYLLVSYDYFKIAIFGHKCRHTFDEKKIEEREWTHFCFLISNKIQKMYIGKEVYQFECKEDFSFPTGKAKYSRTLGGAGAYDGSLPFSGEVVDLRFYEKHLTKKEVQSVYEVKEIAGQLLGLTVPKKFENLRDKRTDAAKLLTSENRKKRNAGTQIGIEVISVEASTLLSEKTSDMIMIMKRQVRYQKAETLCKTMGGTLIKDMTEDYLDEMMAYVENTGIGASRIWLLQRPAKEGSDHCEIVSDEAGIFFPQPSSCKDQVASAVCVLAKKKPLKLHGLPERLTNFFPIPYEHFEFENNQNLRLRFDSKQEFILEKITTNKIWATAYGLNEFDIMGRQSYYIGPGEDDFSFLTLTSCSKSMFTCPNGVCIDMNDTCNLIADCKPSGFDEDVCDVGIPHETFYEKTLAPMMFDTDPLKSKKAQLSLNLVLERLVDVDMDNSVINLALKYTTLWRDDRLFFKFLLKDKYLPIEKEIYQEIWHPSVKIPEASSKFKKTFYQDENHGIVEAKSSVDGHNEIYKEHEGKLELGILYIW